MKDSDHEPRESFKPIFKGNLFVAKCIFNLFKESLELRDHEPGENLLKLSRASQLLAKEEKAFKRKDYLICAGIEWCVFNLHYGHLVLDQIDEKGLVLESEALHQKLVSVPLLSTENQLNMPPFAYPNFLNGDWNAVFFELGQKPIHTSPEDYALMRSWQSHRNLECSHLLFLDIRDRFLEGLENDHNLSFQLKWTKQQLTDLWRNARHTTAEQLINDLYLIRGIAPGSLTQDMQEFYQQFCRFSKGKDFFHSLGPKAYEAFLDDMKKGNLSNALILCWALRKFMKWLTDVLDGKTGLSDTPFSGYSLFFDQNLKGAHARLGELVAELKAKYTSASYSRKEYQRILLQEMKKCRKEYNRLLYPGYFQLADNREEAKTLFLDYCFLDGDLETHGSQLIKSVVLHGMISFLKSELCQINEKLSMPRMNIPDMVSQSLCIFSAMVPDREVSEQMWRALERAFLSLAEGKPTAFVEKELRKEMKDVFKKAITFFNQRLDLKWGPAVIFYATILLKELEVLALKSSGYKGFLKVFLKDLIKLLTDKLKYASPFKSNRLSQIGILEQDNKTQDFKPGPLPRPKPKPTKQLAFNFKGIKDESYGLVREDLVGLGAIPKDTTIPHFRAAITGKEHAEPLVWLAAQGDLVTFVKELNRIMGPEFAPYNQHLIIASIWFVQKGGIPFDPRKLRLSKPTAREKEFIKAAQKIQKKDKKYVV